MDPFSSANMPSVGTPPETPAPASPETPQGQPPVEPQPPGPEPPPTELPIFAHTAEEALEQMTGHAHRVIGEREDARKQLAEAQQEIANLREAHKALALTNGANEAIARRFLWKRYDLGRERETVTGLEWDEETRSVKGEAVYNPPRTDFSNMPTTTPHVPQPSQLPQPRFDQYTGEPIQPQQQGAPGQRYDTYTGEPVNEFGTPLTGWLPPGEVDPGPDKLTP